MSKFVNFLIFQFANLLIIFSSYAQDTCTPKEIIRAMSPFNLEQSKTSPLIKAKININEKDITPLLMQKTPYLGFIGAHKKRLKIAFTVQKQENRTYIMKGSTTVDKNKRTFEGHIVIDTLYAFALPSYGLDDEYKRKVKEEGIIVATYELKKDPKQSATGVFKGKLFIKWYVNQKNQFLYDDIEDYSDTYFNNSFLGTWTSYKTSKSKPCNWGLHRIPCAGDLDYGAAEFSPNEKYYPYGWKDYTP